jgi:hypothetical protein
VEHPEKKARKFSMLKKKLLSSIVAAFLALAPFPALAQVGGGVANPGGQPPIPTCSNTGCGNSPSFPPPAVSACGTSPNITNTSQTFGRLATGTGTPAACTLTWATPRASIPACVIIGETTPVLTITTNSVTALTWTFAATNNAVFDYHCDGL